MNRKYIINYFKLVDGEYEVVESKTKEFDSLEEAETYLEELDLTAEEAQENDQYLVMEVDEESIDAAGKFVMQKKVVSSASGEEGTEDGETETATLSLEDVESGDEESVMDMETTEETVEEDVNEVLSDETEGSEESSDLEMLDDIEDSDSETEENPFGDISDDSVEDDFTMINGEDSEDFGEFDMEEDTGEDDLVFVDDEAEMDEEGNVLDSDEEDSEDMPKKMKKMKNASEDDVETKDGINFFENVIVDMANNIFERCAPKMGKKKEEKKPARGKTPTKAKPVAKTKNTKEEKPEKKDKKLKENAEMKSLHAKYFQKIYTEDYLAAQEVINEILEKRKAAALGKIREEVIEELKKKNIKENNTPQDVSNEKNMFDEYNTRRGGREIEEINSNYIAVDRYFNYFPRFGNNYSFSNRKLHINEPLTEIREFIDTEGRMPYSELIANLFRASHDGNYGFISDEELKRFIAEMEKYNSKKNFNETTFTTKDDRVYLMLLSYDRNNPDSKYENSVFLFERVIVDNKTQKLFRYNKKTGNITQITENKNLALNGSKKYRVLFFTQSFSKDLEKELGQLSPGEIYKVLEDMGAIPDPKDTEYANLELYDTIPSGSTAGTTGRTFKVPQRDSYNRQLYVNYNVGLDTVAVYEEVTIPTQFQQNDANLEDYFFMDR